MGVVSDVVSWTLLCHINRKLGRCKNASRFRLEGSVKVWRRHSPRSTRVGHRDPGSCMQVPVLMQHGCECPHKQRFLSSAVEKKSLKGKRGFCLLTKDQGSLPRVQVRAKPSCYTVQSNIINSSLGYKRSVGCLSPGPPRLSVSLCCV